MEDTWESIVKDAILYDSFSYCMRYIVTPLDIEDGHFNHPAHYFRSAVNDLVDRCKELAEKEKSVCTTIRHSSDDSSDFCFSCNNCYCGWHESKYDEPFLYCPHCGAKIVTRTILK